MKAKFTVTEAEMRIYKGALKDKVLVSLPGVAGKHVMSGLDVLRDGDKYRLTVEYGKNDKRSKD